MVNDNFQYQLYLTLLNYMYKFKWKNLKPEILRPLNINSIYSIAFFKSKATLPQFANCYKADNFNREVFVFPCPKWKEFSLFRNSSFKPILTWKPVKGSKANRANSDQRPHNVAFDQGLQCLLT